MFEYSKEHDKNNLTLFYGLQMGERYRNLKARKKTHCSS